MGRTTVAHSDLRIASLPMLVLGSALLASSAFASELFWNHGDVLDPRVRRCDVASCTPADFATGLAILTGDLAIDPIEGMVYWAVQGSIANTVEVQRRSLSGGAVQDLYVIGSNAVIRGMVVDPVARHLYVSVGSGTGRILRYPMDSPGATPTLVVLFNEAGCSSCQPAGLALDLAGGFLYWADPTNGKIARRTLALGSPIQDVVTGLTQPNGLALDVANDRVYFIELTPTRVRYALLSSPTTTNDVIAIGGIGCSGCLELDSSPGTLGRLFVTLPSAMEIRHCDLDAGCPSLALLASGIPNTAGLALLKMPAVPALGAWGGAVASELLLVTAALALRRRWRRAPAC